MMCRPTRRWSRRPPEARLRRLRLIAMALGGRRVARTGRLDAERPRCGERAPHREAPACPHRHISGAILDGESAPLTVRPGAPA
jgi:hypothetical protein